jgi:hypothetical protein
MTQFDIAQSQLFRGLVLNDLLVCRKEKISQEWIDFLKQTLDDIDKCEKELLS